MDQEIYDECNLDQSIRELNHIFNHFQTLIYFAQIIADQSLLGYINHRFREFLNIFLDFQE
jgi:hypothetical protein